MNFPLFVSALSFIVLLLAAFIGDILRSKFHTLHDVERDDFGVAQNATLTFLGLLIGVSISMAISRHDLRKRLADTSDRSGCRLQAFFLIPDLDSPRGGAIRVAPHNLISLSKSRQAQ